MAKREIKKIRWVEDVLEKIMNGFESLKAAAKIMVEKFNEDPLNAEIFYNAAAEAGISTGFLRRLEAVGRKTMDHRLLSGTVCSHITQIRKLRADLQKRVLDGEKFDYLSADGTPMKICLKDCEKWQADQMYASGRIRTLPEQKAWLEAKKSELKITSSEHKVPWVQKGKYIIFEAGAKLTYKEIRQLALSLT